MDENGTRRTTASTHGKVYVRPRITDLLLKISLNKLMERDDGARDGGEGGKRKKASSLESADGADRETCERTPRH